jgi:hypothetical protein
VSILHVVLVEPEIHWSTGNDPASGEYRVLGADESVL